VVEKGRKAVMAAESTDGQALPTIETNVGFKTTTVRLQQAQFEECELFAKALNQSMTDFIKDALESYVKKLAKDPRVVKSAKRQIVRLNRLMEQIAARDDDDE
jgi:hypothetical protein